MLNAYRSVSLCLLQSTSCSTLPQGDGGKIITSKYQIFLSEPFIDEDRALWTDPRGGLDVLSGRAGIPALSKASLTITSIKSKILSTSPSLKRNAVRRALAATVQHYYVDIKYNTSAPADIEIYEQLMISYTGNLDFYLCPGKPPENQSDFDSSSRSN